jgi:diguanylate cyclase (GGDEF)-like protein
MANSSRGAWWRRWWIQTDHYDWLVSYLKARRLLVVSRCGIACVVAVLATLPLVMLHSPSGPDRFATQMASLAAAGCGVMLSVLWATRWPSRLQAELFSIAAAACIALTCLSQSNPLIGLVGCVAFAVLSGFNAFLHAARLMAFTFVIATAIAIFLAIQVIHGTGDVAVAVCALALILASNLGVPAAVQILIYALRMDLSKADHDSLTGLLNRRAFKRAVVEVTRQRRTADVRLVVAVIDLDGFKGINDSAGHAAGNEALIAVAAALRANCGPTTAIGRYGGEEFVVVDTLTDQEPTVLTQHLCHQIAAIAIPLPFTASIGSSSIALRNIPLKPSPESSLPSSTKPTARCTTRNATAATKFATTHSLRCDGPR